MFFHRRPPFFRLSFPEAIKAIQQRMLPMISIPCMSNVQAEMDASAVPIVGSFTKVETTAIAAMMTVNIKNTA